MVIPYSGLEEGITNMEKIVLRANTRKMGIDWKLAYNELRRLTNMMKMEARRRGTVQRGVRWGVFKSLRQLVFALFVKTRIPISYSNKSYTEGLFYTIYTQKKF